MSGGFRAVLRGESSLNIIGRRRTWAIVSAVIIALSLIGLFGRKLNLSLEFTGGTAMTVPVQTEVTVAEVEEALSDFNLAEVKVQIRTSQTGSDEVFVRAEHIDDQDTLLAVQAALAEATGNGDDVNEVSIEDVGPSWGRQVSTKALRGLIVFLVLVTLYISLRFEPKMAIAALAALFHDLIATAGIYALVGFQVSPATVIALLTLMGFSLYDTVVVFDRVRENSPGVLTGGRETYSDMVNRSMNEVLVRSINTSLSSVVPVAGLLFVGVFLFGAVTLKDLALAMFMGTLVSTYSSIFVAAPLLVVLKERESRYKAIHSRIARETARSSGAAQVPEPGSVATEERPPPPPITPSGAMRVPRAAPRPRRQRRGKRR